jgi:hypothetical protein
VKADFIHFSFYRLQKFPNSATIRLARADSEGGANATDGVRAFEPTEAG